MVRQLACGKDGTGTAFFISAVAPSLAHMAVDAVPLFIRPTPALRLLRWLIRVLVCVLLGSAGLVLS